MQKQNVFLFRVRRDIKRTSKFRSDILQCEPNDRCFENYRQISSENYRQISSNIAICHLVGTELGGAWNQPWNRALGPSGNGVFKHYSIFEKYK